MSFYVNKWIKFKRVQLNCSIDATGKLDRYIRYPSNWETIERNFKTIRQLPNANIEIHCISVEYNNLVPHLCSHEMTCMQFVLLRDEPPVTLLSQQFIEF